MMTTQPFIDPLNRPSDKPYDQEQGITDNPLLFMGYWALLLKELNSLTLKEVSYLNLMLIKSRIQDGLYTRHPKSLMEQYKIVPNKMSHDENNGIAFIDVACGLKYRTSLMLQYMQDHGNQYYDLEPNSNFFNALKKDPIETVKKLKTYIEDTKLNPNDTNAVDLRHEGDISSLSSYRQPRDIAFYSLVAKNKCSLFQLIWLFIATLVTTKASIDDGSRGGTMLMVWFRNLAISKLPIKGVTQPILKVMIKLFNKRMIKKYGTRYPEVLINAYFDRIGSNGERHPLIGMVGKYLDLNPILV